ncbi:glycosyltransferase [Bacillus methanolicus]|uniref:glycosyltransferase family protein n=1 Tax=Bacillus methanolicus TaxID=1471 RepID=UPI00025F27AE|nr:glycosyltransferase [Bacillus methanolicus]EIJ79768.1 hypothetical protein MGA3_15501 [Bacillus methanolicus MGA3]
MFLSCFIQTINFNSQNVNAFSVKLRTFEISACGAFQLTDVREGLRSFYTPGVDIATFDSPNDLFEKIDYYLTHEVERSAIALYQSDILFVGSAFWKQHVIITEQKLLSIWHRLHDDSSKS